PYRIVLILALESIFREKTDQPYRYMAALFNLFNFRPEKGCYGCSRISKRKCGKIINTKNSIEYELSLSIFKCPDHEYTRHSIYEMSKNAKT
ncbi:MAG: hypothetical protein JSW40_03510, partial [Candidatus Omnitrophota bacterium]